jgi:hypothetical protein
LFIQKLVDPSRHNFHFNPCFSAARSLNPGEHSPLFLPGRPSCSHIEQLYENDPTKKALEGLP